jgi:C-terminal processing protease CtpA/Prc
MRNMSKTSTVALIEPAIDGMLSSLDHIPAICRLKTPQICAETTHGGLVESASTLRKKEGYVKVITPD